MDVYARLIKELKYMKILQIKNQINHYVIQLYEFKAFKRQQVQQFVYIIRMQVKNQYRWLLFLIIPFIFLLIVNFLSPLLFLILSNPLQQESYNNQKAHGQMSTLRSLQNQKTNILASQMTMYINILEMAISFLTQKPFLMNRNIENYENINNSFNQTQKIMKDFNQSFHTTKQNKSMWFIQGKTSKDTFSSEEFFLYQNYLLNLELYLRSTFQFKVQQVFSSTTPNLLKIQTFLKMNNSSMLFAYPSQNDSDYSNINQLPEKIKFYFNKILQNQQNLPTQNYKIYSTNSKNETNLIICSDVFSSLFKESNFLSIICLTIDASFIDKTMRQNSIRQLHMGSQRFYLLANNMISPEIILSCTNKSMLSSSSSENLIKLNISSQKWKKIQASQLYIHREDQNRTYFSTPIRNKISTSLREDHLFYLLTQVSLNSEKGYQIQQSNLFQFAVNTILVPSIVLIIISIVLSFLVLRLVLNKIDHELQKINKKIYFILQDDLGIQIEEYHGSEELTELYRQAKIFNKLYKYTSKEYFVGHFAQKILKYNEALHVFKTLKYETSAILQNLGQCYIYIEEFEKSIDCLIKSTDMHLKKISKISKQKHSVRTIREAKYNHSQKKLMKVVLIRKVFKLIYSTIKFKEFQSINMYKVSEETSKKKSFKKMQDLQATIQRYLPIFKEYNSSNYGVYCEFIVIILFQAKLQISLGEIEDARANIKQAEKFLSVYQGEHQKIASRVVSQEKRNSMFYKMHSLSTHSLLPPEIMKAFYCFVKNIFILNDKKQSFKNQYEAFNSNVEGIKGNLMVQSCQFLCVNQIKKVVLPNKKNLEAFESTQIFKEIFPCKTLHYGPITKQDEIQFGKFTTSYTQGLERQVIMMFDCSKQLLEVDQIKKYKKIIRQNAIHIFQQLIYAKDRISIARFNSKICVQTICNLIYKEPNMHLLKKQIHDIIKHKFMAGKSDLIYAFQRVIHRIQKLHSQKIVILFLKPIEFYIQQKMHSSMKRHQKIISLNQLNERSKSTEDIRLKKLSLEEMSINKNQSNPLVIDFKQKALRELKQIGDEIIKMFNLSEIRNCKLVLFASEKDKLLQIRQIFGLNEINRRLWRTTQGLNTNNNIVYVIDHKHRSDIDRIMMNKLYKITNNSVFIM